MEQTFLNLVHWTQPSPDRMRKQRKLTILGLPSCSRLRIFNLNCSVQHRKHGQPIKSCKEREKVKQDMKNLKLINSKDDLIKTYPDQFKGIGKFPGTYHIYISKRMPYLLCTTRKCTINIQPLVDKKLDKLLEQEVTVPMTEQTDFVSSSACSWKVDSDLRTCLNPTHLNKAIRWDHYKTLQETNFILLLHSS